jgi:hypothetical protein
MVEILTFSIFTNGLLIYICYGFWKENQNYKAASNQYQKIIYLLLDEFKAGDKELFKQMLRLYVYSRGWHPDNIYWNRWSKTLPKSQRFLGNIFDAKTGRVSYMTQGIIENQRPWSYMLEKVPRNLTLEELWEKIPDEK